LTATTQSCLRRRLQSGSDRRWSLGEDDSPCCFDWPASASPTRSPCCGCWVARTGMRRPPWSIDCRVRCCTGCGGWYGQRPCCAGTVTWSAVGTRPISRPKRAGGHRRCAPSAIAR